jgi:hypothetical protein
VGETCDVTLAGGLWRNGRSQRTVRLGVPDASQRWTLLESLRDSPPASRVTGLLAATVMKIGELPDPRPDDVRALAIGDRDRIVLALRARLIGDELECVCSCECGETLELNVSIGALLDPLDDEPAVLEAQATAPSGAHVRVRAATGADHEHAARHAREDPGAAARELVERCVLGTHGPDGASCALDDELLGVASTLLEELDPGAEIVLRGDCPACGESVPAVLDPSAYLWAELEQWRAQLELEVHVLASVYHWSEAQIVALDPGRRARYIELIDEYAGAR